MLIQFLPICLINNIIGREEYQEYRVSMPSNEPVNELDPNLVWTRPTIVSSVKISYPTSQIRPILNNMIIYVGCLAIHIVWVLLPWSHTHIGHTNICTGLIWDILDAFSIVCLNMYITFLVSSKTLDKKTFRHVPYMPRITYIWAYIWMLFFFYTYFSVLIAMFLCLIFWEIATSYIHVVSVFEFVGMLATLLP